MELTSTKNSKLYSGLILVLGVLVGLIVLGYTMGKLPAQEKPSSLKNNQNTPLGYIEKALNNPLFKRVNETAMDIKVLTEKLSPITVSQIEEA
jgi:uncharacterized membrane-anchored protein YhcB (DUF1043 family)